ncbi:MAG: helix-turn-helix transcriptional regulator, partial [Firmicutes bacterium]|nr:helix-turn-helix transcriptional regulator [Bacillota bacterium]
EKSPAHGYELMEHLDQFDFDPRCMDPGQIYRALRRMDKDGLVESSWETSEAGPAKRCYHVTAEGEEFLGAWMETLTKRVRIIGNLLTRYEEIIERKGS